MIAMSLKLPRKYSEINETDLSKIDGGVSYYGLKLWLYYQIGKRCTNYVYNNTKNQNVKNIIDAARRFNPSIKDKWTKEFNRHRLCCYGNGIGLGCKGR